MRFFTVLAALDTGSSFEGMGASREVLFSALAEPALLLGLADAGARRPAACRSRRCYCERCRRRMAARRPGVGAGGGGADDRAAGRERAHSGGRSEHAPRTDDDSRGHGARSQRAGLRLHPLRRGAEAVAVCGADRRDLTAGDGQRSWLDSSLALGRMLVVAVMVGVIESVMARLRLMRVPQLLVGAGALSPPWR